MPGGAPPGKRHAPNGAGSIYKETVRAKRANGEAYEYVRWVGSVTLPNGKRKRVVATTQREATTKLNKIKTDQANGATVTTDRQTVGDYLTWWLANSLRCKPTTLVTYEVLIRLYLVPGLGRVQIGKLQPEHVETMMADMVRKGHSKSQANAARAILRQALNVLLERRRVQFNAAAIVKPYRQEREEPEPMTPEECQRWLAALQDHRQGALFLLAMATGLRQGELLGLRWSDVDLEHSRLVVRQNMQAIHDPKLGKLVPMPITPKSTRGRRGVPLPSFAVDRLRAHQERLQDWRDLAGDDWEENGLVFPTRDGRPQYGSNVRVAFARAVLAAGLPPMRFHNLRHIYQSLLVHLGIHPYVTIELMGHATSTMNLRYTHVLESARVDAADRLDALLRGHA